MELSFFALSLLYQSKQKINTMNTHTQLAALWLTYQGVKVTEKNIIKTVKQLPVFLLERMLTERGVKIN